MPVPFMGPPLLIDKKADFAIAQMPAIVLYLGETLDLMPAHRGAARLDHEDRQRCQRRDRRDHLGWRPEMWTEKRWKAFVPRLKKWMSFWEETGHRHGLKPDSGFLLGGKAPGIADIVTATLWSTMADRFHKIEMILRRPRR